MFETNTEKIFEDIVSDVSKEEVIVEKQESKKQLDNLIVFSSYAAYATIDKEIEYAIKIFLRYMSAIPWIEYSTNKKRFPSEPKIINEYGIAFSFKRYAPYEVFSFYKMCDGILRRYVFKKNGIVVSIKYNEIEDCNGNGFRRFLEHNKKVFGVPRFHATDNFNIVCGIYERRIQEVGLQKSFKSKFDKELFDNVSKIEIKTLRNIGLYHLLCNSRGVVDADDFDWINDHRFIRAYISDVSMDNIQNNTYTFRKPPMSDEWVRSFSCCNIVASNVYIKDDGNLIWTAMCIKPTNILAVRRIMFAMEIYCTHKKCPSDVIYKAFERLLDKQSAEKVQREWEKEMKH